MVTFGELRNLVAAYLTEETGEDLTAADFVINGVDMLNQAINSAKRMAENTADFLYSEETVDLSIASTGTLLTAATLSGSPIKIKRVREVLLPIAGGEYIPAEFITNEGRLSRLKRAIGTPAYDSSNTLVDLGVDVEIPLAYQHGRKILLQPADQFTFPVAAKLEVIRYLDDYTGPRSLTVSGASSPSGANGTYILQGTYGNYGLYIKEGATTSYFLHYAPTTAAYVLSVSPTNTAASNSFRLAGTEVVGTYTAFGSYTGTLAVAETTSTASSDFILEHGWRYLMWKSILELNANIKDFVPRQEGNIDSAEIAGYAAEALSELIEWNRMLREDTTTPDVPPPTPVTKRG